MGYGLGYGAGYDPGYGAGFGGLGGGYGGYGGYGSPSAAGARGPYGGGYPGAYPPAYSPPYSPAYSPAYGGYERVPPPPPPYGHEPSPYTQGHHRLGRCPAGRLTHRPTKLLRIRATSTLQRHQACTEEVSHRCIQADLLMEIIQLQRQ